MDGITQYLLTITAAAIICALISTFLKTKGSIFSVIKLLTGLFMALCAVSPFLNIKDLDFYGFMDSIHFDAQEAVCIGENMVMESTGKIIKDQVAAYILDKAATMELDIEVEVTLDSSNPPQPCAVTLKGAVSPYAKEILSQYINNTLGIAKEDQFWK